MKFAHLADCHIGAWREPKLKELANESFIKAMDICFQEHVDFILIAGDLFNTALPGIDGLKLVVKAFKKLHAHQIPIYMIAGSHDFSPSGKTMIDVLEEAGLVVNLVKGSVHEGKLRLKFTHDKKTNTQLTGMLGRRGMLEKSYYEVLDIDYLEQEPGQKIFLFHSALSELKPEEMGSMDSYALSYLPKGCLYYAGGHVHIVKQFSMDGYVNVVYPGPIFPASFSELEKLHHGGFYIWNDGELIRKDIILKDVYAVEIDANHKTITQVNELLIEHITKKEFANTIVLIRIAGKLSAGKISDINFQELFAKIYAQGAYFVMKNTAKASSVDFEEIVVEEKNLEEVEDTIIKEHLQQLKIFDKEKEFQITKRLLAAFAAEKHEGEKVYEYEDRVRKEGNSVFEF